MLTCMFHRDFNMTHVSLACLMPTAQGYGVHFEGETTRLVKMKTLMASTKSEKSLDEH